MKSIELPCDQYINCPICGKTCEVDEVSGYKTPIRVQGPCQIFLCHNPLVTDPLHYYSHIVDKSEPERLAYQEFSLDLGTKSILFAINFQQQKSLIKNAKDITPLELDFIISPDFPKLESLKKKVRTSITFS